MNQIQPGTPIGIGDNSNPDALNHVFEFGPAGECNSLCGREGASSIINSANALNQFEFILNREVVPFKGNVRCLECIKLYQRRIQ